MRDRIPKSTNELLMKKFIVKQHKKIARLKKEIQELERATARDARPQPDPPTQLKPERGVR